MIAESYSFSWDKNIPLNNVMQEEWHKYAEELFLSCFEIYMADVNKKFEDDDAYIDVIEACAKPENLKFNSLYKAIMLLQIAWRQDTRWGNDNNLYGQELTGEILDEWFEWLKQVPKDLESKNSPLIAHIVWAVAFSGTDRNEMVCRNLNHLLEEHYLNPIIEEIDRGEYWKAQEDEWKAEKAAYDKERKQKYAERSIIGKASLFASELWQSEIDAWRQYDWGSKEDWKGSFKGILGVFISITAITILIACLIITANAIGFSMYIYHGSEPSMRVALYPIMGMTICFIIFIYALISNGRLKLSLNKKSRRVGGINIRPLWIGSIYCFIYSCISVFIDWITGYYIYRGTEANFILQILILGLYCGTAFFTFCLWARSVRLGPLYKNNEAPSLSK